MSEVKPESKAKTGHRFQKGETGNPKGRKPLPKDIRAARSMATEEMLRAVIEVRRMTVSEVKTIDLETLPLGKRAIISAYTKNDYKGIKDYEDRLFGKAHETVALTGEDGKPIIPQKVVFEVVEAKHEDADSKAVSRDNQAVEV